MYIPPPGSSGAPVSGLRRVAWNTMMRTSPNQKIGTDWPMNASVVVAWSKSEYCRTAESIPAGIASAIVTRNVTPRR